MIAPGMTSRGLTQSSDPFYSFTSVGPIRTIKRGVDAPRHYALDVVDCGAPVGFDLAVVWLDWTIGIVSDSGNVSEEGAGREAWGPLRTYLKQSFEAIRTKYVSA